MQGGVAENDEAERGAGGRGAWSGLVYKNRFERRAAFLPLTLAQHAPLLSKNLFSCHQSHVRSIRVTEQYGLQFVKPSLPVASLRGRAGGEDRPGDTIHGVTPE